LIEIRNLIKSYGDSPIIRGMDLHIHKGEFVFLQGSSGSGKSTLLKLIYRDIEHFEGEISINGNPIAMMPRYQLRRLVGVIFQSHELLERKTALENVALAGEVIGRKETDIHKEAMLLLERVGLATKCRLFPHQLSGGEQQRVAIARALLNRPSVLLADEPSGNLDYENAVNIIRLLREINREDRIAMVIVTHANELVREFPARTLIMNHGRLIELDHTQVLSS
jgi:cell division transport system ATP-binding protein